MNLDRRSREISYRRHRLACRWPESGYGVDKTHAGFPGRAKRVNIERYATSGLPQGLVMPAGAAAMA
jgi:hypothetical protein